MSKKPPSEPNEADSSYSDEETERRAEVVIKRMLATPPQPHPKPRAAKPKERPTQKGRAGASG